MHDLLGAFAFAALILGQFAAVVAVRGSLWTREPARSRVDRAHANAKLVADLRESSRYLEDGKWHQTAIMVAVAADEIERLSHRPAEIETA